MGVIPSERPVINTQVFPLPPEPFITLHVSDFRIDSKAYDYWPDVVKFIKPVLNYFGFKIYQIGGPNDPIIRECDANYLGLSYQQSAYIQQQSVLHVGVDSLPCHLASAFNKKIVALYSHIYHEQANLAWSNKNDVVYLEPDRGGKHPCFSAQEFPKTVNKIKLEDIARAVFQLLNLPVDVTFQTKFVGQLYQHTIFEVIPDFFGESAELKNAELNLRLDKNFDQQCAHLWAQNYKVKIISDRPVDLELLRVDRSNINQLTFLIGNKESFSLEYIKEAKKLIPNLVLVGTKEEELSDLRLKFFDWTVERLPPPERSKLEQFANCKFWTNKTIFSKAQRFPSMSHWKMQKPFDKENFVVDCEEFARDLEHFYIYQ
jgi:hypothetical protein